MAEKDQSSQRLGDYLAKVEEELRIAKREIEAKQEEVLKLVGENTLQNYNREEIRNFLSKPYAIVPKGENQWYVIVPRFIDLQIGWLLKQTESYNVFVVDVYSKWLYGIPKTIENDIDFVEPLPITVDGDFLKVDPGNLDAVFTRYRRYLQRRDGTGTIKIKRRSRFSLIAELVKDGILPFSPKQVGQEDLIQRSINVELRDYQKAALEKFLQFGNIGVFWMPSAGKTIIGLAIMSALKGRKLIVVPTRTLIEQWRHRINKYTKIPFHEVDIITYNSARKVLNREYTLAIFDECHHLPANVFSRLALVKTKYRLGLSATPYREDGRNELIFSLTGFPVGLDWKHLMDSNIVKKPNVRVIVSSNDSGKLTALDNLLTIQKKTLIFCDSIQLGKKLAVRHNLKFIHGASKNRLATATGEKTFIISRVGDEGISLGDLERVIEFSFLFGSRRQELQRLGRLFHSTFQGEHIIMMTKEEFALYRKRLFSIYEKGIDVRVEGL